ncbi:MAG: hypothetical protein EON93_08625, partial [Burkholderiales bacterium]
MNYYNQGTEPALDLSNARTATHGGARRLYAPESGEAETALVTRNWLMEAEGRVNVGGFGDNTLFEMDGFLVAARQPPFYPRLSSAVVQLQQVNSLSDRSTAFTRVVMTPTYVRYGFDSARDPVNAKNPMEEYLDVLDARELSFDRSSGKGGGFAQGNMSIRSMSRSKGALGGNDARHAGRSTGLTRRSPAETFGKSAKLFNVVPLPDVILDGGNWEPVLVDRTTFGVDGKTATSPIRTLATALRERAFGLPGGAASRSLYGRLLDAIGAAAAGTTQEPEVLLKELYPDLYAALMSLRDRLDRASIASDADIFAACAEVIRSGQQLLRQADRVRQYPAPEPLLAIAAQLAAALRLVQDELADLPNELMRQIRDLIASELEELVLDPAFRDTRVAVFGPAAATDAGLRKLIQTIGTQPDQALLQVKDAVFASVVAEPLIELSRLVSVQAMPRIEALPAFLRDLISGNALMMAVASLKEGSGWCHATATRPTSVLADAIRVIQVLGGEILSGDIQPGILRARNTLTTFKIPNLPSDVAADLAQLILDAVDALDTLTTIANSWQDTLDRLSALRPDTVACDRLERELEPLIQFLEERKAVLGAISAFIDAANDIADVRTSPMKLAAAGLSTYPEIDQLCRSLATEASSFLDTVTILRAAGPASAALAKLRTQANRVFSTAPLDAPGYQPLRDAYRAADGALDATLVRLSSALATARGDIARLRDLAPLIDEELKSIEHRILASLLPVAAVPDSALDELFGLVAETVRKSVGVVQEINRTATPHLVAACDALDRTAVRYGILPAETVGAFRGQIGAMGLEDAPINRTLTAATPADTIGAAKELLAYWDNRKGPAAQNIVASLSGFISGFTQSGVQRFMESAIRDALAELRNEVESEIARL